MWQLAGRAAGFAVTFIGGVALARLLEPEDFGLWALAFFCMKLARQAASIGLLQAVVQRPTLDKGTQDTAFWGALLASLVLGAILYLAAPAIGRAWNNDQLAYGIRFLSVVMPLSGLITVPQAVLQRGMRFGILTGVGLTASCAELGCSLAMALLHHRVNSLYAGTVTGAAVMTIGICVAARCRPGRPLLSAAPDLLRFALPVTASYLVRLIASDADYIIIGRRLSTASVGLYRRAYSLTSSATAAIITPAQDVLFPAFSRLQAEPRRLQLAFARSLCGLGTVVLPTVALLYVVAPEFVPLVYGAKWQASVVPAQVLCLPMVFMAIAEPSSSVLRSVGRAGTEACCQASYTLTLCVGAWVGAQWGIVGVASAVTVAVIGYGTVCCALASRAVGLSWRDLWTAIRSPVAAALATLIAAEAARTAASIGHASPWLVLAVAATVGAATGAAAVQWGPFAEGRQVLTTMLSELRRQGSAPSPTEGHG